jgi:pimeloyl-ACP methyl ester carboxylesterase
MTAFLLIHGIPGSAAAWDPVAARLAEHHSVLAPDLLGFRGSRGPDHPDGLLAPGQARHLLALLDDEGIDRVLVVGHDFGGPVAVHLAAAAPERVAGLALFATNAFPDTPIPFPLSLVNAPVVGGLAARLLFSRPSLALMLRRGTGTPSVPMDVDRSIGDRHQRAAIAAIFTQSLRRLDELYRPVEAALASLAVPALVGWGDRDPFFPLAVGRRTAALIPDARFHLYAGAGHFLPEERPAEVAADLLALASAVDSRRR